MLYFFFFFLVCCSDTTALDEAALIVNSHRTRKEPPRFGVAPAKLVEYGIARLRDSCPTKHEGAIVEPLPFLTVTKWLEGQDNIRMTSQLKRRLAEPESRGGAYEEVVILYLLRTLSSPIPLSGIFSFYGTTPDWAGDLVSVTGRQDGEDVNVSLYENPSLYVTNFAGDIDEVLAWLEAPTRTVVLVPCASFGPDVLMFSGKVLLIGQMKSYLQGNARSLNAATLRKAITSLNPSHWFKMAVCKLISFILVLPSCLSFEQPPHKRDLLIKTINSYKVLRFVAGYPLPPDLNLKADWVVEAIAALGHVALATLEIDAFRSHFISDAEARTILEALEYALDCKRETI